MELTPVQLVVVGLVASGLSMGIRFLASKWSLHLSKFWMSIIVSAVSVILAVIFNLPELPVYTDPLQYLGAWLLIISGYLGMATLIYNLILDKLVEKATVFVGKLLNRG